MKYDFDVIIPTYNPSKDFEDNIELILGQSVQPKKILIINTDKEKFNIMLPIDDRIVIRHIEKSQFDHGGTRNYGALLSFEPFMVFMTQDAKPYDSDLFKKLLAPFDDQQISVVYGRQLADEAISPIEAYTRRFNYPESSRKKTLEDLDSLGIKTFFCSNVCAAYRKSDYDMLGGFSKHTIFNEDMIFASKLIENKKAVYYESDAIVWHWHEYTLKDQYHRNFDLAVSQVDAGGLFLEVKSEGEGIKLVYNTIIYLLKAKKVKLIPKLIAQSGAKYLGYRKGKKYKKLSYKKILKFTMNPSYWEN